MPDFIPRPDARFGAFVSHFLTVVSDWWADHGLDPNDLKPLNEALAAWNKVFPAHVAAQAQAESARQAKDAGRVVLEGEVRPIAAVVQSFIGTTNADRAAMGITVRQPGPALRAVPSTRPLVRIASGERLTHTIRFGDEGSPQSKARPKGALGAEVYYKLVPPNSTTPSTTPTTTPAPHSGGAEGFAYLTLATNGAAVATFPSQAAGQTAVYVLRWAGPRGQVGPWSEQVSATVAA